MAWIDFWICFFLGFLGVHKFRENKKGMGILYICTLGLFGIGWIIDSIKYFIAAVKGERLIGPKHTKYTGLQLGEHDPLPVSVSNNLILSAGEVCHFSTSADILTLKNRVVGYTGGSSGVSIRIARGMSYRVGATSSQAVRDNVLEKYPGMLTVTNKRVVFTGMQASFDKKMENLSSITPLDDAVIFQFGSQQYTVGCVDSWYVYQIIARVVNTSSGI